LINNSDFSNGSNELTSSVVSSLFIVTGEASYVGTAVNSYFGWTANVVSNHVYYASMWLKADSTSVVMRVAGTPITSVNIAHSGSNLYELKSYRLSALSSGKIDVKSQDLRTVGWTQIKLKYGLCLDLTDIFGSGNEPSLAEMDSIMSKFTNSWFRDTVNPLLSHKELMNYLNKNKANIKQEDWITPTKLNSWVDSDTTTYAGLQYMKDSLGWVNFRGLIKSGTLLTNICVLLVGYRVLKNQIFDVAANGAYGQVVVRADGGVQVTVGSTGGIDLSSIRFKAEA